MALGFMNGSRKGRHFELVSFAMKKIKSANLALKGKTEKEYEQAIVGH